jgi:methionyl aminopeptidase
MIVRKRPEDLEKMRRSGLLVWKVLNELESMVGEGVTTLELERAAEKMFSEAGARPAFKGYYVPAVGATYPFVLCTSVNEEVVHGMPSAKRVLKKGDIVSIDTGASLDGYFGDSAITVPVGEVDSKTRELLRVTREALDLAVEQMRPGNRLSDVCGAVERHVTANKFSVVREYVGHGIGTKLHEEPQVPNYVDRKNENPRLDRRHPRRFHLGALRALRGGDRQGTVGADKAMTKETESSRDHQGAEEATVVELLPNAAYRLELDNRERLIAHAAGVKEANFVRLRLRDRVMVELSAHDRTRARIVKLLGKG